MVIMGYGFDKANYKYYFRFYDLGRSTATLGTSEQNILFINKSTKEITNTYRDKTYKIVEIRKNL